MTVAWKELPTVFLCQGCRLVGIATIPDTHLGTGVLIVVGGPQYRAGSHRQFTLLARDLAKSGIASFRFDYRGMGDSEGDARTFEDIAPDIQAAINTFLSTVLAVRTVVIWGLCDAASAAAMFANADQRVRGLVLLNPWIQNQAGAARVRLLHYYLPQVRKGAFWTKLLSGKMRLRHTLRDIFQLAREAFITRKNNESQPHALGQIGENSFANKMTEGLNAFPGGILLILSKNDFTAREFVSFASSHPSLSSVLAPPKTTTFELLDANHTFSTRAWRDQVASWTTQWIIDTVVERCPENEKSE